MTKYKFEAGFVGRFQPLHNGHLQAVKSILEVHKNLLIIVGSSQEEGTKKNPLSYEFRKKIIIEVLKAEKYDLSRVEIVPLPDINNDSEWVDYLIESVPSFEIMYTGAEDTRRLFELNGRVPVRDVNFLKGVSGTLVRQKITKDESIDELVPKKTKEVLGF
jgi:nicotinamide-nucleotide adenylyltransferase